MKLKIRVLIGLMMVCFLSYSMLTAEDQAPAQILKAGDVEHFIKTFPQVKKDLDQHGVKYDSKEGMAFPEAVKACNEFSQILKENGWDETFFAKTTVICLGYTAIVYSAKANDKDDGLEAKLKEIEKNPNLTPQLKKQLRESLAGVNTILKEQLSMLNKRVSPADIELIRPFVTQLKGILEGK